MPKANYVKTENNSLERKPVAAVTTNLRNRSSDFEVNYEKATNYSRAHAP